MQDEQIEKKKRVLMRRALSRQEFQDSIRTRGPQGMQPPAKVTLPSLETVERMKREGIL